MGSPRSSLYRAPAGQPSASPPKSTSSIPFIAPRVSTFAARKVAEVFALAGIQIGGRRPWDLQVRDERFYARLLAGGDLAAGESYMDSWWEAEALDELCTRVHRANLPARVSGWKARWLALEGHIFNRQRTSHAAEVAQVHYDRGNDLYKAMLNRRMQYTCGYWKDATTLDQAQENKLHLICRKLQLQRGMSVLELRGRFWRTGSFHGLRIWLPRSDLQHFGGAGGLRARIVRRVCRSGSNRRITAKLCTRNRLSTVWCEWDFANISARKITAGSSNWCTGRLSPGALFLLHTIGGNESYTCTDAWIDKYIFPNGMTPSVAQLGKAMEGLWVVEDWHNFGPGTTNCKTLMAWWHKFDRAWPSLEAKYGDRFYRMWKYYLLGCAGGFRARRLQLWQLVLSKGDIPLYMPVR